jgi:signal transduction histidine kinase
MPEPKLPVPPSGFLATEPRMPRLAASSSTGFLVVRLVLAVSLFLQIVAMPARPTGWMWLGFIPALYTGAAGLIYGLRRAGRLSDAQSLGSFLLDVSTSLAVLYFSGGAAGGSTYTALLLLIMGACLLRKPALILAVTVVAVALSGVLAPPPAIDAVHVYLLRLTLFLLIALFTIHIADYAALIERQTAKRYEEQIAWMQRLSLVGKAMAAVLHEAKTPLGTIVLSVESAAALYREGKDPSEDLRVIGEEADHARIILQNFLDFVKPTRLDLARIRVREPLVQALSMTRVRLDERDVEVEVDARADCEVLGSARHLLQAFTNVVNNAVDAMPGGGRLRVRLETSGAKALIHFEDDGVGMAPEDLARLFEPFATSKKDEEGHGLGLSIVRWILQEHGGEVRIESPGPGRGARVVLVLPLAPAQ